MDKIKWEVSLILILLSSCVAFAAQNTSIPNNLTQSPTNKQASNIIVKIEANYSQIRTISGRILQTRSLTNNKVKSKLNFFLKMPDKLYLDYLTPQRQTIVSNGKTYWSYSPSQNKAVKANLKEMENLENPVLSPMKFLGINIFEELEEAFNFRVEDSDTNQFTLCATPKSGGKLISQVKVKIDPIRWVILSVQIFDKKNDLISQTSYEKFQLFDKSIWFPLEIKIESLVGKKKILKEDTSFHRVRLNMKIPEEKFNFTPPKGIEILSWQDKELSGANSCSQSPGGLKSQEERR
ncbi:MAG: DUF4292 domain-containing protein [bacterium]|nr:DUF4292 domain-containing protein [bacterium]